MKFLSQINVNTEYTLPIVDGTNGQVLTTDGSGAVYWGSVSIGALNLDGLQDVVITTPTSGQILRYGIPVGSEDPNPVWYNWSPNFLTFASSIDALADVTITSAATGQLLQWNGSAWVNATLSTVEYVSKVQHTVKAGVAISKGQAVYVTGADGTNMIVGLASNASEATSSKVIGLAASSAAINDQIFVVTEGLIAGLDTSTATAGDPVWLGTNGNLIFGLANKPVAPAHLVYIGVVTRVQSNNGEIFINVQNGFELNEIHDALIVSPTAGQLLRRDSDNLWKNWTPNYLTAHPSIQNTGSVNNSLGTVVQDITLDANGHVTTIGSVNLDNRYYTQDDIAALFGGDTAIAGYNLINWDAAYADKINSASFSTTTGVLTLTQQDAGTITVDLDGRYLQSFTETDPTVPAHVKSITATNISNWNDAFNDSIRSAAFNTANGVLTLTQVDLGTVTVDLDGRYLETFTETDPTVPVYVKAITETQIGDWDRAYNWGNHADAGYLTSLPAHTHAIADVTGLQTALDGKVPTTRTLTINGTAFDLSANRSWTISSADGYVSDVRLVESTLSFSGEGNAFTGNIDLSTLPFQPVGSYLTAEADTLQTVTSRGSSTNTDMSIGGAGGDRGLRINHDDYGRIRFYQGASNLSTIHSFSTSWAGGDVLASGGALNLTGNTGVTIGGWNVPDVVFRNGGSTYFRNSVGIGSTAPDSALEVNGRVSIRGANELYFGQSTSSIGSWTTRMYASGSTHKFNAQTFIFNNEGYGGTTFAEITSSGVYSNASFYFPQTQFNPSAGARTTTPAMSIKMWDNYFAGIGLGSDYGTVLQYYSRGAHVDTQVYFDAAGGSWYRTAAYAAGYGAWNQYITSGNIASQSVSYATSSGNSVSTDQTNFSALFIEDAPVATKEFVTSQGYITGDYLPLTGGTLSGTLTMGTTGTQYIRMGRFPGSTTNTGEAWIGRASDRNIGTMTVQLGGNSASGRSFEVVDYAWSVVLFSVDSSGNLTTHGTITENSSIRYKKDVVDIESTSSKVQLLRPVKYKKIRDESEEIGLIAEDVAELFPEVVKYDNEGRPDGVNYSRLSVILLKAVQELSQEVNELKKKLN